MISCQSTQKSVNERPLLFFSRIPASVTWNLAGTPSSVAHSALHEPKLERRTSNAQRMGSPNLPLYPHCDHERSVLESLLPLPIRWGEGRGENSPKPSSRIEPMNPTADEAVVNHVSVDFVCFSLSPSDGERAGVRGIVFFALQVHGEGNFLNFQHPTLNIQHPT